MDPRPLCIGIVCETFETYPRRPGEPADAHAEYEPETTIEALESAIEMLGHRARRLGSPHELLDRLASGAGLGVDAALNIAEGYGSRNREAWAPVLLEMAGVPMLGSDALTLSTSLDKAWTNRVLAGAGVPVAKGCLVADAAEARALDLESSGLEFPLFVKPRFEGSAKGIRRSSRVEDRKALVREVARVAGDYRQAALVEAFVPGAEYTVAVVGNCPPRALPVLQRALDRTSGIGLHALGFEEQGFEEQGFEERDVDVAHHLPGSLDAALERRLQDLAVRVFELLECLDFCRCDFRLDAAGEPVFLELNPLPTFAVDGTFAILAELEGRSLGALLADVIGSGLTRLGLPASAGCGGPSGVAS